MSNSRETFSRAIHHAQQNGLYLSTLFLYNMNNQDFKNQLFIFLYIFGNSIITQKSRKQTIKNIFVKKKMQTSFQSAMFWIKILKAPLDKCQVVMEYMVGFIIYNP